MGFENSKPKFSLSLCGALFKFIHQNTGDSKLVSLTINVKVDFNLHVYYSDLGKSLNIVAFFSFSLESSFNLYFK